MRRSLLFLTTLFAATLCCIGQVLSKEAMEKEGQRIASELRNSIPTEGSSIHGVLEIRSKKPKVSENIPIICSVVVGDDHWDSIYETGQTESRGSEKLIVRRFEKRPNQYWYAKAPAPKAALPEPAEIKPELAEIPLAGSDFSLADLGLDFLHWPLQRRPKGEMRLNNWCHVLESVSPKRAGISRVVSWIDQDSADKGIAGILIAEAYSPKGEMVKLFSLGGSSFKKVNGRWQLEKMDIENTQTKSKTTLRFDLNSISDQSLSKAP